MLKPSPTSEKITSGVVTNEWGRVILSFLVRLLNLGGSILKAYLISSTVRERGNFFFFNTPDMTIVDSDSDVIWESL